MSRIPKLAIPQGFEYLDRFLGDFLRVNPHTDRNVFVMLPFSAGSATEIYSAVTSELEAHGLIALRADQRKFSPVLWWNVATYILGCSYGIVIYEPYLGVDFNPNVSIEAGFMLALDRPVLFLVDENLARMPVDLAGHIYKQFKSGGVLGGSIREAVRDWIEHDLSYCDYGGKKLLVFVSLGGTCRCVMAKAILAKRLSSEKISNVAVEAAAIADPHHPTISPSALTALSEIGCAQLVSEHRPRKLSTFLQHRADLIIALTDASLARTSHTSPRIVTDEEVFGTRIANPYPDNEDSASLERYRISRDQIEHAIDEKFWEILERFDARPTL